MGLILEWNNEQTALEIGEPLIAKLRELLAIAGEAERIDSGEVVLSFVDDETIRALNRDYRNIDKATDVLSFSMLESVEDEPEIWYGDDEDEESDEPEKAFGADEADDARHAGWTSPEHDSDRLARGEDARFDPDADGDDGEDEETFVEPIGDIVISVPRAIEQAKEYGHSIEREIGFLFVHGFLHLIGYDHGSEEEERIMFAKQEAVLQKAGLTR
jgi:probable rRNA maturation factor